MSVHVPFILKGRILNNEPNRLDILIELFIIAIPINTETSRNTKSDKSELSEASVVKTLSKMIYTPLIDRKV